MVPVVLIPILILLQQGPHSYTVGAREILCGKVVQFVILAVASAAGRSKDVADTCRFAQTSSAAEADEGGESSSEQFVDHEFGLFSVEVAKSDQGQTPVSVERYTLPYVREMGAPLQGRFLEFVGRSEIVAVAPDVLHGEVAVLGEPPLAIILQQLSDDKAQGAAVPEDDRIVGACGEIGEGFAAETLREPLVPPDLPDGQTF